MVSLSTWVRYICNRMDYSILHTRKVQIYKGQRPWADNVFSTDNVSRIFFFQGKMTYLHHWKKGEEMAPTIGGTLLVLKLPHADPKTVFVGDVVVVKDPEKPYDHIVRRLAAVEGDEMVSADEKKKPFVLEKGKCWILSDNEALKAKEARDSRTFGPLPMTDIVGRVIYCLRTARDHGPVQNSHFSMESDSSVIEVELDVDEMATKHKA